MRTANKAVRQSVSLPAKVATEVRSMARIRRLSANRMLVELIENGIAAERQNRRSFLIWPNASGQRVMRTRSNAWAIRWAEWFSAADA